MATNPSILAENVGRIIAPNASYPYGSAQDDSTGTTGDGTPIKKAILNDAYGFQQWLLDQASIVPSGAADTVLASQYGEALLAIIGGSAAVKGHIDGGIISNGTDSDHDIDITSIVVGLTDGSGNYKLFSDTSPPTKQIDANWAEGDGLGGFPSGLALAANTEYNFFIIGKDDGTIDAGFDTSLTAANLLADATDYDWYSRIGSVFTDGSSNILGFYFEPDTNFFRFKTAIADINDLTLTQNVFETGTVTVPPNKTGKFDCNMTGGDEDVIGAIKSTTDEFELSVAGFASEGIAPTAVVVYNIVDFFVDSSSQLKYAITTPAPSQFVVNTLGFYDNRR